MPIYHPSGKFEREIGRKLVGAMISLSRCISERRFIKEFTDIGSPRHATRTVVGWSYVGLNGYKYRRAIRAVPFSVGWINRETSRDVMQSLQSIYYADVFISHDVSI